MINEGHIRGLVFVNTCSGYHEISQTRAFHGLCVLNGISEVAYIVYLSFRFPLFSVPDDAVSGSPDYCSHDLLPIVQLATKYMIQTREQRPVGVDWLRRRWADYLGKFGRLLYEDFRL